MSGGDSLHPRPLGSALKDISAFFGRSGKTPRSPPDENAQSSASPAVVAVEETPVEHALVNMEAERGTLLASESAGQTMVQLPLLVPPSSTEQELASSISKLQEALAVARELHEFTKDRNNVHAPIKKMSVSILSSLTCIERELLTMKMRVERIEKASMKPKAGLTTTPISGKRNRKVRTPEEAEEVKRAKNDAPNCNQIAPEPIEEQEKSESSELWSTVVSKKAKRKATIDSATDVGQGRPGAPNGPTKLTSWRPKTEAILVETNEVSTHKDILRKLKTDPELQPFGKQVARVRSTKNGGLLFELKKNDGTYSEDYSEKIQKAIGESGKVKTLGQMETVEIRYIDEETEADDVEREVRNQFACTEGCKLEVRMKSSYSGMQTAIVKLPAKLVPAMTAAGKIQIGWSVCPVRVSTPSRKCYRCWQTGHISQDCKGPDRSKCCLRCGDEGHFASACQKTPRCVFCPAGFNAHHSSGAFCPVTKKTTSWK
ncbi:uncharacterized protein LOC133391654 [Anopheles gambiae]|uniref:uncharacterized protein LOC133391654 n=1 Tax=Anopheles gambiae TaxID=7165 RepID=UPI002AC8B828|nr:uncharacterized protein LOC133391654 [Anopheles gambiae]